MVQAPYQPYGEHRTRMVAHARERKRIIKDLPLTTLAIFQTNDTKHNIKHPVLVVLTHKVFNLAKPPGTSAALGPISAVSFSCIP